MKRDPQKIREWRARSQPLKAGKQLQASGTIARRSSVPKVNRERKARRKAEGLVYGPYHRATTRLPCIGVTFGWEPLTVLAHRCSFFSDRPGIESHHVVHVGTGGKDEENTVPVCPGLHDLIHGHTWSITRRVVERSILRGRTLDSIALELAPQIREVMRREEEALP